MASTERDNPWSVSAFPAQLLDHVDDGVLAYDRQLKAVFANRAFCRLAGVEAYAIPGRDAAELLDAFFGASGHAAVVGASLDGRSTTIPVRRLAASRGGGHADGERFAALRIVPLQDGTGRVTGGVAVVQDLTRPIASEAEARESESRFRIMADNAPVYLWMSGPDARCTFFNQRWLNFTGRTMAQEEGYGWAEGVHAADFQRCVDTYMAAFSRREEFTMEYRLRRADGEYRWVLDNGIPRFRPDGGFAGYIGSCIDITDRKEVEVERERMLAREREALVEVQRLYDEVNVASRLKDEFLATLSHELRTPLNAISGWAELLVKGQIDPSGYGEAFDAIDRNARSQAKLINDILDVSRIVTGQLRLDVKPVELRGVLSDAMDAVSLAAQAKKIEVVVAADPTLGPVEGDPMRLTQIFWNLLVNAVKFTPEHGRVEVTLERQVAKAVIRIRDTGHGIAPEFLPFVFERFRQADGSFARRFGGLGLGLAIVKHLVELHGGTVAAASQGLGHGALFTVTLPLVAVRLGNTPDADASSVRPHARADQRPGPLAGVTVLAVDDQPDVLRLLTVILESAGAAVVAAGSAAEAMALLGRGQIDILLCDIGMPDVDGYQFMAQLRQRHSDQGGKIPAAAVTAHTRDEDRARALECGFQAHVIKPVEPAALVRTVARLAQRAESQGAP